MECYASLSRRANDILKAIGGNIKWDYADSISEVLTPEKFSLHKVSSNHCVALALNAVTQV